MTSPTLWSNPQIAALWRQHAELPLTLAPCDNSAGAIQGMNQGYMAACAQIGRRVYVKPVPRSGPDYAVAAREKIASDLAHELGLCVPPVVLVRLDGVAQDQEPFVCASLVLFARQYSWYLINPQKTNFYIPPLIALMERIIPQQAPLAWAFDTWVGQPDHGDTPQTQSNIILGYGPGPSDYQDASLAFLDYALAFGAGEMGQHATWTGEVTRAPFPDSMKRRMQPTNLEQAVSSIEAIPQETIREIVRRIPQEFLSDQTKASIEQELLRRQRQLRAPLLSTERPGGS